MAMIAPSTASSSAPQPLTGTPPPSNGAALSALTVLFFMFGFLTCLNDILIPYLKAIFQLSFAQANLVNFCFFGAYFFMSIPAGRLVKRVGYKQGMLLGFVVAAAGCMLFYPAASSRLYGLFLGALFILATGITLLQVAGNPYVAVLGPPESASSRLTLTQAFNSLGTTLAPILGSAFILSRLPDVSNATTGATIDVTAVQLPYLGIGVVLLVMSAILSRLRLPHISSEEAPGGAPATHQRPWHYRHLVLGCVGIFAYVGAEVAIGSHIVSYLALPDVAGLSAKAGGDRVAYYWGAAMVGRFLGAYLLRIIRPSYLLAANALAAVALVAISASSTGAVAMWTLLAVGLMNSLMFSTIFTLALDKLGRHTEEAAGLLCTAIVGGAIIPVLFGAIADKSGLRLALLLPVICYLYIAWYATRGYRQAPAA